MIHSDAQVRKTEVTKGFQQMLLIGVLWASYVAKNLELYSVVHLYTKPSSVPTKNRVSSFGLKAMHLPPSKNKTKSFIYNVS